MKKQGVLQHRLAEVIAMMGHTDALVVGDAGLPVPAGVERIDLAVRPNLPRTMDVVEVVATELQVEQIVVAEEATARNPEFLAAVRAQFPGVPMLLVPHDEFKARSASARAVVRTGECSPYANVLLISGVTF
jgi:D-ribose pyranase